MRQEDYRRLFLIEFTRELIFYSKKPRRDILPHHPLRTDIPIDQVQIHTQPLQVEIKPRIETHQIIRTAPPIQQARPQFSANLPPTMPMMNISPQPIPAGFTLGKLDPLLSDNMVTSIECSGPGRPVLVKTLGKVSATQISLDQEEIQKVIDNFSQTAKIPPLGGVFKAAVGSLIITAVISEFVGSRFIINKYTPYSILDQAQHPPMSQFPGMNPPINTF
jgi:hypothetical protein